MFLVSLPKYRDPTPVPEWPADLTFSADIPAELWGETHAQVSVPGLRKMAPISKIHPES